MSSALFSLNTLTIVIIVAACAFAIFAKKLITSVIAMGAAGAVMALEFVMLHAPDVALAEAAVGAVITTVIFIVAIKKTEKKKDKEDKADES